MKVRYKVKFLRTSKQKHSTNHTKAKLLTFQWNPIKRAHRGNKIYLKCIHSCNTVTLTVPRKKQFAPSNKNKKELSIILLLQCWIYYTATLLASSSTLINKVNTFIIVFFSYSHFLANKLCGHNNKDFWYLFLKNTATCPHQEDKAEEPSLPHRNG